jgi:hypothetical protein
MRQAQAQGAAARQAEPTFGQRFQSEKSAPLLRRKGFVVQGSLLGGNTTSRKRRVRSSSRCGAL